MKYIRKFSGFVLTVSALSMLAKPHEAAAKVISNSLASNTPSSDQIIKEIKERLPSLRHDSKQLKASSELVLIKEYLDTKYKYDPDLRGLFVVVKNADKWIFDNLIVGTWAREHVKSRILEVLPEKQKGREELIKLFSQLIEDTHLDFGFDGFEQNGCAGPTAYLLILNTQRGRVDGIDLIPCQE